MERCRSFAGSVGEENAGLLFLPWVLLDNAVSLGQLKFSFLWYVFPACLVMLFTMVSCWPRHALGKSWVVSQKCGPRTIKMPLSSKCEIPGLQEQVLPDGSGGLGG